MDIRKWLAETEAPIPFEQLTVEPFRILKQPAPIPDARRTRKRCLTDSSLLSTPSPQLRRKGVLARGRDRRDVGEKVDMAHSDISHSTRSESVSDRSSSQRYARQPRRKTHPDRYDVETKKSKEQKRASHVSRKSESKISKRKSRRSKAAKTHTGIGKQFHAKNVSKDRLTLKPLEKLGLFSKGRASTSVLGRGLPDLVFSEMRFLRNNHGEIEDNAQGPDLKKRRRKDRARTKEDDISTFFTSVRPALADVGGNKPAKGVRQTTHAPVVKSSRREQEPERKREQPAVLDSALPTIEAEGKSPYMESHMKVLRHDSSSYSSWSEFVRAPTATPGRQSILGLRERRSDTPNHETRNVPRSRCEASRHQDSSSAVLQPISAPAEHLRMSLMAPLQPGLLRSQSAPQCSSSPQRRNSVVRASNLPTEDSDSPFSIRSGLPTRSNVESWDCAVAGVSGNARSATASYADGRAVLVEERIPGSSHRIFVPPQSSQGISNLSVVLQQCNRASQTERQRSAPPRRQDAELRTPAPHEIHPQYRRGLYPPDTQVSRVRFAALDPQLPQRPNCFWYGLYAQGEQRQQLPVYLEAEEVYEHKNPDTLGQYCNDRTGISTREGLDYYFEEAVSSGLTEELEFDGFAESNYAAADVEQVQEPAHTSVVRPRFWRPNKLY